MTESRKRVRSQEEDDFMLQTKYFVNQQLVDKSSDKAMKSVYGNFFFGALNFSWFLMNFVFLEKTLSLIFAGAKLQSQSSQNKANNNKNDSLILDTVDDVRILHNFSYHNLKKYFKF